MTRPHALLVGDDDPDNCEAAQDVCQALGYRAHCVDNLEDLLAALEAGHFCGCLLDLEFPARKNSAPRIQVGWTGLERIQALRPPKEFPVVIMTGHGDDHRYPATATLLEAAAFIKKPFNSPGDMAVEDVLRRVLRRTCEARFPERCPNFEPPSAPKRKRTAQEARDYRGKVQLYLHGNTRKRLARIEVDQQEKWVRISAFKVLYLLVRALKKTDTETLNGRELGAEYNHAMSRAKADLAEKAGLDPKLIENDGAKGYRLSVPPDLVDCDVASVRSRYAAFFAKFPW